MAEPADLVKDARQADTVAVPSGVAAEAYAFGQLLEWARRDDSDTLAQWVLGQVLNTLDQEARVARGLAEYSNALADPDLAARLTDPAVVELQDSAGTSTFDE